AALPPSLAESLWLSVAPFELFEALPCPATGEIERQTKTKPLGKAWAFRTGRRQSRANFF
ncbi:MAG TPA: hypothetical protein VIV66_06765, partial [Pyrinomonadaceae bacterium]